MRASSLQVESKVPKRSKDFIDRVNTDGGSPLSYRQVKDNLYPLDRKGILEKASLVLTPSGWKSSKLYVNEPNDGTADFDFTQNTTNGTIINEQGKIETVPANTPRIDWLNGVPEILVEESRTNLVTYSDDFTVADWSKIGSGTGTAPVVTANSAPSIFEGQNAQQVEFDRGVGNTSSDTSGLYLSQSYTSGVDYTGSIWVKAATATDVGKEIAMRPGGGGFVVITLTNQWQKYEHTLTTSYTSSSFLIINRGNVTVDNQVSLLLAGVQNEQASEASSTIQTNGATATRNDDILNKTGISSLIGQNEGTIFIHCNISDIVKNNTNFIFDVYENPVSDRISVYQVGGTSNIRFLIEENNTVLSNIDIAIPDNEMKIAVIYTSTSFKVFINGVNLADDVISFPGFTSCENIHVGSRGGSSSVNEGLKTRNFFIAKTPISQSEAEKLTTL